MEEKRKVCHLTSTHAPKDQRIFEKECRSLSDAGYDVTLVEQGKSEECEGVHIRGTGECNQGRFYRLLVRPHKVYKIARKLNADIYHFHDMELLPYGLKLKRRGKTVIFDCHEDFASRFAESDALKGPALLKRLLGKLYCTYEKRVLKKLDAVLTVTPHIADRLAMSNPNTLVVTNYPLLRKGDWLVESEYRTDSDYLGFAGQISDTYSLRWIAQAIQAVPDIRFKICGPLRKEDDWERIRAVDQARKVDYLGKLSYSEVPFFFRNARAGIVIHPYCQNVGGTKGSLGTNKLFEGMLSGIPIICTDFELWKEINDRYHFGICINPQDETALIQAIRWIWDHPAEAAEMGRRGRAAVLEQFNWKTQEQILLETYAGLSKKA